MAIDVTHKELTISLKIKGKLFHSLFNMIIVILLKYQDIAIFHYELNQ